MELVNQEHNISFPAQRFFINNGQPMSGQIECPQMLEEPEYKEWRIVPFDIEIKLTSVFEPGKPSFNVISKIC